jgi:hypothetical protein
VQPPSPPFRWDLVTPDQLGSLLAGTPEPDLWFAAELIVAAGRVVARSGGGDLYFVGRYPDSMFDLLSGAFGDTDHARRLHRLAIAGRDTDWRDADGRAARGVLEAAGLFPAGLARTHRVVAFVDLVAAGGTLGSIYHTLREWVEDAREPWPVIRRKLRFVSLRRAASETRPAADWPAELPSSAVLDVSIDDGLWDYFANSQAKLTRRAGPREWSVEQPAGPGHDEQTRAALAEAVALVALGRHKRTRSALAHTMASEPAYAESWLRGLARQLS